MTRAFHVNRAATIAALVLLLLHAFVVLDAMVTFRGSGVDNGVPLRFSAELGVIAFGSWLWLIVPLLCQSALLVLNLWIARFVAHQEWRSVLFFTNALIGALFLLGTIGTIRVAIGELSL